MDGYVRAKFDSNNNTYGLSLEGWRGGGGLGFSLSFSGFGLIGWSGGGLAIFIIIFLFRFSLQKDKNKNGNNKTWGKKKLIAEPQIYYFWLCCFVFGFFSFFFSFLYWGINNFNNSFLEEGGGVEVWLIDWLVGLLVVDWLARLEEEKPENNRYNDEW